MKMPDGPNIHTHVQVSFEPENGKTRIRIVRRHFPGPELRGSFESGWGSILEGLARVVDARVGGGPPRAPSRRSDDLGPRR
jgi:Activator of Hsp90 ATPase homolog 1-like protein